MKLKNIHNRKDYLNKLNEIIGFGGTSGGVGDRDGFANNAKLKDTMLGGLINGIFKGIGWLWRKTKEKFVISKLKAQLINELMRGVILFCFDNNIDLKNGSIPGEQKIKGEELGEGEEHEGGDVGEGKKELGLEELKIEIPKLEEEIKTLSGETITMENDIATGTYSDEEKAEKQKQLDEKKSQLSEKIKILDEYKEKLKNLEEAAAKTEQQSKDPFFILQNATKTKYNFDPNGENPIESEPDEMNTDEYITVPYFKEGFKNFDRNKILFNEDKFKIKKGGTIGNITITNIDKETNEAIYETDKRVKIQELYPFTYPSLKAMSDKLEDFIKEYGDKYNTMSDEDKEKLEVIYMNRELINSMRNYSKKIKSVEKVSESLITEENLIKSVGKKLTQSAGTAKFKPDEPAAGKVGLGKSISMKAGGVTATVGDILTSRDRKRFSEREDDFKMDIHDVDLAGIETTVDKLQKEQPDADVKLKVSTYVNPYNLKAIQLSADQLLAPIETEGGTKTQENLKLRWNKEVAKINASFTNIMDIEKVNIAKSDYGDNLNNKRVEDRTKDLSDGIGDEKKAAKVVSDLSKSMNDKKISSPDMKDGLWCYYNFTYDKNYNTTIAPVGREFSNLILLNITSCFESVDVESKQVIEDSQFGKVFKSSRSDVGKVPKKINVYFLMKTGQKFPIQTDTKPRNTKIFVLNEYVYSDNTTEIFLKKKQAGCIRIPLVDKVDKSNYIHTIKSVSINKFKLTIEDWLKVGFNFSKKAGPGFNDFQKLQVPPFIGKGKEDTLDRLKKLSELL